MSLATPSRQAALGLAAKAGVSGLLVWLVATRIDLTGVGLSLAHASTGRLVLGFAAFLLIPLLGGLRWWVVLRGLGEQCRVGVIVSLFSAATLVGQVLPSVAGDGVRVWLATRRGHELRNALQSVLLERVLMVLALLVLALATAPLLAGRTGDAGPVWICAALLAVGLCGACALMTADLLPSRLVPLRPLRALAAVSAQTRGMVFSRWGVAAALISIVSNVGFILAAVMLARALGVAASTLDFVAIMPAVTLATTLPVSLGGWGVREGVLVLLLGRVGVAAPDALAFSLTFGVFGMLCGLPGLLAWSFGGSLAKPAESGKQQYSPAVLPSFAQGQS